MSTWSKIPGAPSTRWMCRSLARTTSPRSMAPGPVPSLRGLITAKWAPWLSMIPTATTPPATPPAPTCWPTTVPKANTAPSASTAAPAATAPIGFTTSTPATPSCSSSCSPARKWWRPSRSKPAMARPKPWRSPSTARMIPPCLAAPVPSVTPPASMRWATSSRPAAASTFQPMPPPMRSIRPSASVTTTLPRQSPKPMRLRLSTRAPSMPCLAAMPPACSTSAAAMAA